jgi:hypothetical protein
VNTKFITNLTYPDVYMCIPALGMRAVSGHFMRIIACAPVNECI